MSRIQLKHGPVYSEQLNILILMCLLHESNLLFEIEIEHRTSISSRKSKGKKHGYETTMAFRGAYGELSLLCSFLKKGIF